MAGTYAGTVVCRAAGMTADVSLLSFEADMKHYMNAPMDYCKAQRRYVKGQLRRVHPQARFVCELQVIELRLADLKAEAKREGLTAVR